MYRWLMLMVTLIAATLVAERSSYASIVLPDDSAVATAVPNVPVLPQPETNSTTTIVEEHAVSNTGSGMTPGGSTVVGVDGGAGAAGCFSQAISIPVPVFAGFCWQGAVVRVPAPPVVDLLRPPQFVSLI